MPVRTERHDRVLLVTIDRPEVRNAVDRPTADELEAVFRAFDGDDGLAAAVLAGAGGTFCAGADLHAIAAGRSNRVERTDHAPMGPTRLRLGKPTIAAVEGHAVAGGLELALWCDLRVAGRDAVLGVFSRRWGVPLVDGGTVRLPRVVGLGRALDLILTGRPVPAEEALAMGLVDRVVDPGSALAEAVALAAGMADLPQGCLRSDRESAYRALDLPLAEALLVEHDLGAATIASGESVAGAGRFADGAGRHGTSA